MAKKPKLLVFDIETLPNQGWFWQCGKQYMGPNNILKERSICTAAWKWVGQDKVYSVSGLDDKKALKEDPYNDKVIVTRLHAALEEAQVLIGHNSNNFDMKMFNARAIKHGLPPVSPKQRVDTLTQARKHFRFNSNKLDYIGEYLGLGKKIPTSYQLWMGVMNGDVKSIKEMLEYNREDVRLQERVYLELRPYMESHPNMNILTESEVPVCRSCGQDEIEWSGLRETKTAIYRRYKCKSCFTWGQAPTNIAKQRPVLR